MQPRPLVICQVECVHVIEVLTRELSLSANDNHTRLFDGRRCVRPASGRRISLLNKLARLPKAFFGSPYGPLRLLGVKKKFV